MNPYEILMRQGRQGVGAMVNTAQTAKPLAVNPEHSGARNAGLTAPVVLGIPLWVLLVGGAVALFMLPSGK